MRTIICKSVAEVKFAFNSLSPDSIFRGQTKEFLHSDGSPSLTTSFSRHGCIPERMLKWYHYARTLLSTFVKEFAWDSDMAIDQAILQHYGWRSFFIDATESQTVAAWFAANEYKSNRFLDLIEDCWEEALFAIRERAWYEPSNGIGCVYAISRKALRARELNAVDLVEITTETGQTRFRAQSAFMVGPVHGTLPQECILAKILAPSNVFADYVTGETANHTMEQLFPDSSKDPVLSGLLALPWVKREVGQKVPSLDYFERGLPLPEYHVKHKKISSPETVFYRRYWISDLPIKDEGGLGATIYLTSDSLFHGSTHGNKRLPKVAALVREKSQVVVEIDGLIFHPYQKPKTNRSYGKGIFLKLIDEDVIFLTEVIVEQYGLRPAGFGISLGMYYRIQSDGLWEKISHPEECDCGNERHHHQHFVAAEHFEAALEDARFTQVRNEVFAEPDVIAFSDEAIIRLIKEAHKISNN